MERKRVLQGEVVTLVAFPQFLPVLMWPQIGDYDNPYITKLVPCEVRDGTYYNLRTNLEVKKSPSMLEWKNLSGSVFRYRNSRNRIEENLLISRRFENGKLVVFDLLDNEITTTMVPRKIFEKKTKDD
jgi:hypothetical protein